MPNLGNILGLLGINPASFQQQQQPPMGLLGGLSDGMPTAITPEGMPMPLGQQQPGPFGLLNQPQSQPQSPALPTFAQPDIPAPGAVPAGPAQMPPMPPERPAGVNLSGPLQLPGARPPVPVGGQDMPISPMNPDMPALGARQAGAAMASPAAPQTTPAQGGGFFDKLGTLAGSIYGGGRNPGDNLIALGAGLASGPNWGQGLMKGMSMVNANALTAKKTEEEQKKTQGQFMLAQHLAKQSGGRITPEAALGIIQSGNAGQFLTEQFRSPTSEQEFNIYRQSETQAGRTPLTFDQWYTRNKQIESGVGETAFDQNAAKSQVERLNKTVEAGGQARASLVDIQQMRDISGRLGSQGSAADLKARLGPMAEALGIKIDGLSDIQSFNSIIQRVAPTLREPGSGSTSDIEFKGMLSAMPQLSSNPAAREAILNTMEALARDKAARSEIAGKILNKEIPRQDGDRMMRELPDPMTGFAEFKKQNPQLFGAQPQQQPQGAPPVAGARQAADGNWYVQQNGKWFKVQQ